MTTAKLLISLDFELGWGVAESGQWREREEAGVYRVLRPAIRRLLDALDSYDAKVIWAIVGGMLQKRSEGEFDHLPGALAQALRTFVSEADGESVDARDLMDMVEASRTRHQIASHSYSHARFSYPGYDLAGKTQDLKLSCDAMRERGHEIDALVFPINHSGDYEALAANNFRIARVSPDEPRFASVRPLNKFYYRTIATPPPVVERTNAQGIVEHAGSLLFLWPEGRVSGVRRHFVARRARQGLHHVAEHGGSMHLWFHPFDMVSTPGMESKLHAFLRDAVALRDAGKIEFAGM